MLNAHSGDRLRSEDAVFLYLETPEAPLHIGSISIFDGKIPFQQCMEYIESRLPLIPRYRQRIVVPPFHFGHPTWEADPEFDIHNHVREVVLKRGTESELRAFAGRHFSRIMDRNRPLWDMTVVDGLEGGRSALISRVHHCLVDGVSGVGLMNVMLDPSLRPRKPQSRNGRPAPLPGALTSLADALSTGISDMMERFLSAQSTALDLAHALVSDRAQRGFDQLVRLVPELMTPVDRLPFNRACSGARKVAWTEIAMAEVKSIRESCGGTLNDVMLTVLTAAVRRYALLHRVGVKGKRLRLMVPVNVRREGMENGLGNRVSMLPVSVPLDVTDPVELLELIRARTEALKSAHVADLIYLIATWMGMTPVPLQAAVGPLSSLLPVPPFNMVCTNVPGPQAPLYALGHKMVTYHPYVPIANQMGLGCAIQSYNGTLFIGLSADAESAPDVERLRQFLDEAFRALCRAAGVTPASVKRRRVRRQVVSREAGASAPETKPPAFEPARVLAAAGD
ncbi:MAG TPA: wax ester/triacylglycerol synthase family O-acyltransferase [Bryobacteraceae bacterium]|nr:wax ester/triacylglycerol synthase family O-acyltransferase [Bryobacteraceae bacterium]